METVYSIINDLKRLSGLGVCLYDIKDIFIESSGNRNKQYHGHYCDYCVAVKKLPGGQEACTKNDKVIVGRLANLYGKPFFNVCHAKVCEYIVPIFKNKDLLGVLLIGQCRMKEETELKGAFELGGDLDTICELYNTLPIAQRETMTSLGNLANLSFKSLSLKQNFNITHESFNSAKSAKYYIDFNFMNSVSLTDISKEVYANPSYLSRSFKKMYGIGLLDYITNTRLEHAKKLLLCSEVPISHIALNTGFSDPNYFSRVFKKAFGVSPREFRKIATAQVADAEIK